MSRTLVQVSADDKVGAPSCCSSQAERNNILSYLSLPGGNRILSDKSRPFPVTRHTRAF